MYLLSAVSLFVLLHTSTERVLLFVQPYMDGSGWYAEPIALIGASTFADVVNTSDTTFDLHKAFSKKYFERGLTYTVYVDDAVAGKMSILDRDTEFACMQITAQVKFDAKESGLDIGDGGLAFAGAQPTRQLRSVSVSTSDSNGVLRIARQEFTRKRVPQKALKTLQLNRIRKIDLNGDGEPETICTFDATALRYVKQYKAEVADIYFLALIIERGKIAYNFYTSGEEGSETAMRSDIAGVSDLNGDGSAEVILRNFYYESWDFTILQLRKGRWQKVWQGGGGGC